MTTKVRSACDRCHQTKVRCNGGVPCRGCLTSKTLCFYSVSNALGRPRGAKQNQNPLASKHDSASNGETTSDRDRSAVTKNTKSTTDRSSRIRQSLRTRSTLDKDESSAQNSSGAWNILTPDSQMDEGSRCVAATAQASRDNTSITPTSHDRNGFCVPQDVAAFYNYRYNQGFPKEPAASTLRDTPPYTLSDSELSGFTRSDVTMSDFAAFGNIESPIAWDDLSQHGNDSSSSVIFRTLPESSTYQTRSLVSKS